MWLVVGVQWSEEINHLLAHGKTSSLLTFLPPFPGVFQFSVRTLSGGLPMLISVAVADISPTVLFTGFSHSIYTVTFESTGLVSVMKLHCPDNKQIQAVISVPS